MNKTTVACVCAAVCVSAAASRASQSVVVTKGADTVDGNISNIAALKAHPGPDGKISLREAVLASDNTPGDDPIAILFQIPESDETYDAAGGNWRIRLDPSRGQLPFVRPNVVVAGGTQQAGGEADGGPAIVIDGSLGTDSPGLVIAGEGVRVHKVGVVDFDSHGIAVAGGESVVVSDCLVERNAGCGVVIALGASGSSVSRCRISGNAVGVCVGGADTDRVAITESLVYDNLRDDILLEDGANGDIRPPSLFTVYGGVLYGNAGMEGGLVELFAYASGGNAAGADQAMAYLGSAEADERGAFAFPLPGAAADPFLAATVTDPSGGTSALCRFPPVLCVSRPGISEAPLDSVYAASAYTGRRLGELAVGRQPFGIAVDRARRVFVANRADNSVSVLRGAASAVLSLDRSPVGVTLAGDRLAVVCLGDDPTRTPGEVKFFDGDLSAAEVVPAGVYPFMAAEDPLTGRLFVPNGLDRSVSVLEENAEGAYENVDSFDAGKGPCDVLPSNGTLIIADYGNEEYDSNILTFLDAGTGAPRGTIHAPWGPNSVRAWGRWLFVSTFVDNRLTVFDRVERKAVARFFVGGGPGGMGLAGDGTLFVPLYKSGGVSVISCNALGVPEPSPAIGSLDAGSYARFAAVSGEIFCRPVPGVHLMAIPASDADAVLTLIMIPPEGGFPPVDISLGLFTPGLTSYYMRGEESALSFAPEGSVPRIARGFSLKEFRRYTFACTLPDAARARAPRGEYAFEFIAWSPGTGRMLWRGYSNFVLIEP